MQQVFEEVLGVDSDTSKDVRPVLRQAALAWGFSESVNPETEQMARS